MKYQNSLKFKEHSTESGEPAAQFIKLVALVGLLVWILKRLR